MRKLTQCFTVAEHGKGDCWRTAIACLLDCDSPEQVPDFGAEQTGDGWVDAWHWLRGRGLTLTTVDAGSEPIPTGYYLLDGLSPRTGPTGQGLYHVVVAKAGLMVHDPHPSRAGLLTHRSWHLLTPVTDPHGKT